MSSSELHKIETLIGQLDKSDKLRLLQWLAPQVANANQKGIDAQEAWRQYRQVGDKLAATSSPGAKSLTEAVSEMRR